MKRRIYSDLMIAQMRSYLTREVSKFISSFKLTNEDVGRDYNIDGKILTLMGLTDDKEYPIIMQEKLTSNYYSVSTDSFKTAIIYE